MKPIAEWKTEYPQAVVLFRGQKGTGAFGPDAELLIKLQPGCKRGEKDGQIYAYATAEDMLLTTLDNYMVDAVVVHNGAVTYAKNHRHNYYKRLSELNGDYLERLKRIILREPRESIWNIG